MLKAITSILFIIATSLSFARNTPCSGKMGGISHCDSGKFICNNGSVSKSKKTCRLGNTRNSSSATLPAEANTKIYQSIDKNGVPTFSDNM